MLSPAAPFMLLETTDSDAGATADADVHVSTQELIASLESVLLERQELVIWLEEQVSSAGGSSSPVRAELLRRLHKVTARQEALLAQLNAAFRPANPGRTTRTTKTR
jgi:hypothetical protein